jgi:hypothetical protein
LIYLILSYDWETASRATITDQQELLKREFGLRVSRDEAKRIVLFLANRDISRLLHYSPVFAEYLEESLTSFQLFLLEVGEILDAVPESDWRTYENEMRQLLTREIATNNIGLNSLAYTLSSLLPSLLYTSYSIDSQLQLQELTYAWLPELIRVLAPEKYEELYQ